MQFFLSVYQQVRRNLKKKLLKTLDKILKCCIFASLFEIKQNNNNNNKKNSNNKKQKEMKTQRQRTIGKIKGTSYRNTSYYGNPSYYILFETETGELIKGYTAPNAECAYGCTNSELREFACIVYHITKGGKVIIDNIMGKSTYDRNNK